MEKGKLGTINGISNWHKFTWPETGEDTGYICTRALPGFGKWNKIAPGQIDKIAKQHTFERPSPNYTTHTQSSKS
ncbi:20208_t:CDS:2 [Gigaspora rosea]|nr:20208_t:CDS:2 [Gigaspora rosea]